MADRRVLIFDQRVPQVPPQEFEGHTAVRPYTPNY